MSKLPGAAEEVELKRIDEMEAEMDKDRCKTASDETPMTDKSPEEIAESLQPASDRMRERKRIDLDDDQEMQVVTLRLLASADKGTMSCEELDLVIDWIDKIQIGHDLLVNFCVGFVAITGIDDDGPQFKVTPNGRRAAGIIRAGGSVTTPDLDRLSIPTESGKDAKGDDAQMQEAPRLMPARDGSG